MCTESLCAEIVALCGDIHRAEYRLLTLIEKLDASKSWRHEAMPTCAHWLNAHCGIDLVTAREKVRIAHALPRLPLIRECFRSGELSYSKVRAITRVAGSDNEAELVQMARANTAAHVARNVAAMRQAERLSESKAAFDAYRHRTFTCHTDEDGTLVFEGRLPADQGALLVQALDRAMDWLVRGASAREIAGNHERPSRDVQQGRDDRCHHDDANVEVLPQTVRRADALAILAERFLAEPPQADEGLNTADRFQITVHASAEALLEHGVVDADDPPQIEDGVVLATETLRRLACDSAIVRILETGAGGPLDIGRKTRVIPPSMRRALKRRDRGCRFPNCTNTRFVDGHHITHWADGGATRLDNLVLLCRHHHRLLHEGMYYVVKDGAHFIFCRGDGEEIPAGRETPIAALIERARSRLAIAAAR
jgi:hypothetical protein